MNDSILVNYYDIDNKNYLIVNEADYNNNHYVYLINENDKDDIMVRRRVNDLLEPLDSEEELLNVMKLLIK